MNSNSDSYILLFDGTCVLCNSFFKWVVKRDRLNFFKFATIQSEVGISLLQSQSFPEGIDSIVLTHKDQIWTYSTAVLRTMTLLGGWPAVLGRIGLIFPKTIRDIVYRWVATHRYRWFGEQACMIPDVHLKSRFLS